MFNTLILSLFISTLALSAAAEETVNMKCVKVGMRTCTLMPGGALLNAITIKKNDKEATRGYQIQKAESWEQISPAPSDICKITQIKGFIHEGMIPAGIMMNLTGTDCPAMYQTAQETGLKLVFHNVPYRKGSGTEDHVIVNIDPLPTGP